MGPTRIRVLIADDNRQVRSCLRTLLCADGDIEVIGEAADGVLAAHMAQRLQPDVVLMDIEMPRMGGTEATRCIRTALPATRVVALGVYETARAEAADAGCACFVLKDSGSACIAEAVRRAHHAPVGGGDRPMEGVTPDEGNRRL